MRAWQVAREGGEAAVLDHGIYCFHGTEEYSWMDRWCMAEPIRE